MKNKLHNPWQTKKSDLVYSNSWIEVHHNEIINPSGGEGIYGKVHFKNTAVGIIPLDEAYNTWIVGQYRYPLDIYSWEIPEGGSPKERSPLVSAQMELKEETGITATSWLKIMDLHTSNSVTDETAHIYIAKDLSFGPSQPEETELIKVKKIAFKELLELTMQGKITDAMSVAGILKTASLIRNKEV